jgi:NCS2 family nucleobase:cation symporter-2
MLQPIFGSEMALATVLVIALNLLFRIGVAKTHTIELQPDAKNVEDTIITFMEQRGAAWGMRKEVEERAAEAIYEVMLTLRGSQVTSPVTLRVRFDEFNLDADLEYDGIPVSLPDTPPTIDAMSSGEGLAMLSGYIVRQHADRVNLTSANGRSHIQLHFDH